MNIHLGLAPLVSLIAGILILAVPRLLNYIVAIYLIVIGLIGLSAPATFTSEHAETRKNCQAKLTSIWHAAARVA
jgi:lysophospholipid acyltransferase (LPLAT)-like uncharacterized protein